MINTTIEQTRSAVIDDETTRAQAHVVGLLNEVEAVLTGWVLGEDKDAVDKALDPLYEMCDREPPAARRRKES